MIRSMTAFASAEQSSHGYKFAWELRTVNHRYLDLSARLPENFRQLEPELRRVVSKYVKRGKLECALHCQKDQQTLAEIQIDHARVRELARVSQLIGNEFDHMQPISALDVLAWPGVQQQQAEDREALQAVALELLDQTLRQLVEAREREGEQLLGLIEDRCDRIQVQVVAARSRLPQVLAAVRERITQKINDLVADPDQERIEQELVMLAQKMDVDEEMDRLDGHVQEVRRVLRQSEPVGRRLDFLMQEMTRESNTLGSKSADKETTAISIELKVLIEQMREQIQNIE